MRRLYLMLPDPLPDRLEEVAWVMADGANGHGPPGHLPEAQECWLALPAARILLTELALERRALRRLSGRLAYALEERLLQEPESVHVALGPSQDGRTAAAAVDRAWFAQALDLARSAGLPITGATPASLLWQPAQPEWASTWVCIWEGRCGHLRSGPCRGLALDGGSARVPPPALSLAVAAARAKGQAPTRLLLDAARPQPDHTAWAAALGIEVEAAPLKVGPPVIDLLQGEFARRTGLQQVLSRYRLALGLTLVTAATHLLATALHTLWLEADVVRLEAEMRTIFRSAFPETKAVVYPDLQMQRQLERLRAERGYLRPDDLLALLAVVAQAGPPAKRLDYSDGRLQLEFTRPPDLEALRAHIDPSVYRLVAQAEGLRLEIGYARP